MDPDAPDRTAFDAFLLAMRVMYHIYDIDEPATDFEKPWSLIKEIATGDLTLSNPAELASRFPRMADFVYERANEVVADDQRTATRVLRGMQGALGG